MFCFQAEDRAEFEMMKAASFAVREAKRHRRQKRLRVFDDDDDEEGVNKHGKYTQNMYCLGEK